MDSDRIVQNLACVEKHFHSEAVNEVEVALDLYTEDAIWEAPALNGLDRRFSGKNAVAKNYRELFASMRNVRFQFLRTAAGRSTARKAYLKVKFDIYGRFQLEVLRDQDDWSIYRLSYGKRMPVHEFIPPEVEPNDIARYLDDVFHEAAAPGKSVRLLEHE